MGFVLIEKDPFSSVAEQVSAVGHFNSNVRRPLVGLESKYVGDRQRFAYLQVFQSPVDSDTPAQHISLIDSSAPDGHSSANHNFLIQSMSFGCQEKVQVVETVGEWFAFFYGQRPIVYSIRGFLFDTRCFNWKNEWIRNYHKFLRGTRCVENRSRVYLGIGDELLEGYILSTGIQTSSEMSDACPFSFEFLVTSRTDLSIGNDAYVRQSTDGRTFGAPSEEGGELAEYLNAPGAHDYHEIDPSTGSLVVHSGSDGTIPATLEDGQTVALSAGWVGPSAQSEQLWKSPGDALAYVERSFAQQQSGSRPEAAIRMQVADPTAFPLGTRSEASIAVSEGLSEGLSNACAVVGSYPGLK